MKAPDRIWCVIGQPHGAAAGTVLLAWNNEHTGTVEYRRATPELTVLIEAATAWWKGEAGLSALAETANAFARTQDHPDAG